MEETGFKKTSVLFSQELVAHLKIALIHMHREISSEYLEILCLDKLISRKVCQCVRLCDCLLFPYDGIQYRTNEKPP